MSVIKFALYPHHINWKSMSHNTGEPELHFAKYTLFFVKTILVVCNDGSK